MQVFKTMKENNYWKFTWIVGIIFLVIPMLIRLLNDNFSLASKEAPFILSKISISPEMSLALSFTSTVIFILVLNSCLKKFEIKDSHRKLLIAILIFSPSTILMANVLTIQSISMLVILSSIILVNDKRKLVNLLGVLISLLLFFDPLVSLASSIIFLAVFFSFIKNRLFYLILSITYLLRFFYSLPINKFASPEHFLTLFISDFGSSFGISIAFAIFALFGFFSTWRYKWKYSTLYFAILIFIILSNYLDLYFFLYAVPVAAFFASDILLLIFRKKWQLENIKKLSILVVFCIFLFSSISFVKNLSLSSPSSSDIEVLNYLKNQESGYVLSNHDNEFLIRFYSGKDPVNFYSARFNESQYSIFKSSGFYSANSYFDQNAIKYVFYSEDMIGKDYGIVRDLHYVLENFDDFRLIHKKGRAELWQLR